MDHLTSTKMYPKSSFPVITEVIITAAKTHPWLKKHDQAEVARAAVEYTNESINNNGDDCFFGSASIQALVNDFVLFFNLYEDK